MRIHSSLVTATVIAGFAASAAAIPPAPISPTQLVCNGGRVGINTSVLDFSLDLQNPATATAAGAGAGAGQRTTYSQATFVLPASQFVALAQAEVESLVFKDCTLTRRNMTFTFTDVLLVDVAYASAGGQGLFAAQVSINYTAMSVTDGSSSTGTLATEPLWSQAVNSAAILSIPLH